MPSNFILPLVMKNIMKSFFGVDQNIIQYRKTPVHYFVTNKFYLPAYNAANINKNRQLLKMFDKFSTLVHNPRLHKTFFCSVGWQAFEFINRSPVKKYLIINLHWPNRTIFKLVCCLCLMQLTMLFNVFKTKKINYWLNCTK